MTPEKLPSINTLAHDAQALLSLIEDSGGELTPEIEQALAENMRDIETKVDHYAHVFDRIPGILEYWRKQREDADRVIQGLKNLESKLNSRIKEAMTQLGRTTLEGETTKFTLSKAKAALLLVESEVPQNYFTVETVIAADKERIRADLTSGIDVPGASLVPSYALRKTKKRSEP